MLRSTKRWQTSRIGDIVQYTLRLNLHITTP